MRKKLLEDYELIVSSDVSKRDGIGIEVWKNNEIIIEIFRDDKHKINTFTAYKKDLSLELIEKSILYFKKEIPNFSVI